MTNTCPQLVKRGPIAQYSDGLSLLLTLPLSVNTLEEGWH
jgi:hypothetical protein